MKVMIILVLFSSVVSFADMEHKEGQGSMPASKELTLSRGCFHEISKFGCGHPVEDQEYFITCLADNISEQAPNCRSFFERLYGKKK